MNRVSYIRNLLQVPQLDKTEIEQLGPVEAKYKFRANDYYLGLINWDDPNDPIRQIIVPQIAELEEFGDLDASDEETNYVAPGCQHKYASTALLLCNEICGAYCRFCFRKRLFMNDNDEAVFDVSEGIEYIRRNPQISNVLLTGGDPLLLSTRRLESIIKPLREIDHVHIIRIGSKMPAFNPFRISEDEELLNLLSKYSQGAKRIYVMTHFNVPQELTDEACHALDLLHKSGVILANQTPLLKGINDNAETLASLMRELSHVGVPPYYFFQCRPTEGNKPYGLPLVEGFNLISEARRRVSGLAKRARLVMSHSSGKVEIVGVTAEHIFASYHRAKDERDDERFLVYQRDDEAYWLDDLVPVGQPSRPVSKFGHQPHHALGPE